MNGRHRRLVAVVAAVISTAGLFGANDSLPYPEPSFAGRLAPEEKGAEPDWPSPVRASAGMPNVVIIMLDDVGFGAAATFGGAAQTPALDRLAARSLIFNRFHTAALCSPSRASLLTGRNPHQVGFGTVVEGAQGYPGYNTIWGRNAVSIAEVLRQNGYSTAAFGKWHNTPKWEAGPTGPFNHWPNALGFDYFYGFLGGATSQWEPRLYRDTTPVEPGRTPEQGYHLTPDLVDDALHWLDEHQAVAPGKPYFLYFATGALHAPHHVPRPWVDRYRGKFDQGWDKLRVETFARQRRLGLLPPTAELTPRPAEIPAWESLSPDLRRLLARQMEVFAGFLEQTDYEVGRLVDGIESSPGGENTLIFYIVGDNGGSAEGGIEGTDATRASLFLGQSQQLESELRHIDGLGGPRFDNNYSIGWAWATSTPFQWMKQFASHFGGTRNPLLVAWPRRIRLRGVRAQFHHVNDVAPTIYEATGIPMPSRVNGIEQLPLEGTSMVYSFDHPDAPGRHRQQYFEVEGNRAIYADGWVAAAHHGVPWVPASRLGNFSSDHWELYHIDADFSEAHDLASRFPEKLQQMQALFDREAVRNHAYPVLVTASRLSYASPFSPARHRNAFIYHAGNIRLPPMVTPDLSGRSHRITARVEIPSGGAEGVIIAQGGRFGGFTLYVKDRRLVYENNEFSQTYERIVSDRLISTGPGVLVFEFISDSSQRNSPGLGRLFVNGERSGEVRLAHSGTSVGSGLETLDIGMDVGAPVSQEYRTPFAFTGTIREVKVDLTDMRDGD